MKKRVIDQLTITIIYLFLISVWRFKLDLSVISFILGGLLGSVILWSDYLFQVFLIQPELTVAQEARKEIREFGVIRGIKMVFTRTNEIKKLTFHTIFFQLIFLFFSFFVMTSSGSLFGQGLVLSVQLYLLKTQYDEYRADKKLGPEWYYRLNVKFIENKPNIYLLLMLGAFLISTSYITR